MLQNESWQECHNHIIDLRNDLEKKEIPGEKQLENVVSKEVDYLYKLWEKQYESAAELATEIFQGLEGGSELSGYRAYWQYLAGCAHLLRAQSHNDDQAKLLASNCFNKAHKISSAFPFLKNFEGVDQAPNADPSLEKRIQNIMNYLRDQKIASARKFSKNIDHIIETLKEDGINFENAHELVGKFLGFETGNPSEETAPDPYWILDENLVIVFEDKLYENENKELITRHIRQAALHDVWIKKHLKGINEDAQIIKAIISNSKGVEKKAHHFCDDLFYWNHAEFVNWSTNFLNFVKALHVKYAGDETGLWKEFIQKEFDDKGYSIEEIRNKLIPITALF